MPRRFLGRLAVAARVPGRFLPPPQPSTGARRIATRPLTEGDVEAIFDRMSHTRGLSYGHAEAGQNLRVIVKIAAVITASVGTMMILVSEIDRSCEASHKKSMAYVLEREKLREQKARMGNTNDRVTELPH